MIINNKENRDKYLDGLDPSTKVQCWYKGYMRYCNPVQIRHVDWKDPKLMGFIFAGPSYDDVTEEEDAAWKEAEDRMDVIGQNGNDGLHYSKYHREIKPGIHVDVYDVLAAWQVTCPALQHLIKKALQAGNRGHKTLKQDLVDIVASAKRAEEMGCD